jgi:hypothetical protein
MLGNVSTSTVIPKTKMLSRTGIDSVYCTFLFGSTLYCWNIGNNNLTPFTAYTNIRDFDVSMSSTGSVYTIIDLNSNNDLRMYGTTNGGVVWGGAIYLSSTGARGTLSMSGTGDTCLINYYGPPLADTLTSAIRNVRYRESAPGTLSIVGSFTSPVAAGTTHDQFMGIKSGPNAWIIYTSGITGGIDLNCIVSTDGGTTYGSPFTIGAMPNRDEYWFDAKWYSTGGGVDLIYYSDTLQVGSPTNASDRMYHCYATNSNPTTFSTPAQFSDFPPGWSARGYIPTVIEYNNAGVDLGAIWVGQTGANKKLYFDRFLAVVGIDPVNNTIPEKFALGQNYPNPFNPSTKIDFSVPVNSQVTMKLYDVTGKEVAILLDKQMSTGNYNLSFNASSLPSGVYFYTLSAGSFTETKKMVLVK